MDSELALRFASRCNAAGKVIAIRREIRGGRGVVFAHAPASTTFVHLYTLYIDCT
jgi:hypothetical protein